MDIMEIVLLAAGGIVFILSFLIPAKREESSEETRGLAKEEIKTLVSEELEAVRGHVDDVVEEAVTYSIEKTERSLERLSNEKIMAVNEYSDTVLSEIHKNHEEVMFLYDMLNDKHANLKDTVSEINRTVKEAKETKREAEEMVNNFQRLAPETVIPLKTMELSSAPIPVATPMPAPAQGISAAQVTAVPQASLMQPESAPRQATASPLVFASAPLDVMVQKPVLQKTIMAQEAAAAPQKVIPPEPVPPQTNVTLPSQTMPQVNTVSQTPTFVTAQKPVLQNEFTTQDITAAPAEAGQAEAVPQTQIVSQSDTVLQHPEVQQTAVIPQHPESQQAVVSPQHPEVQQTVVSPQYTEVQQPIVVPPISAESQVFASAPVTVAPQQVYVPSTAASGYEAPMLSSVISFTQETDMQGRNYNDRILELYKSGKSKVAIAKELNLGVGEVKLVIDLYKNRSEK